MKNPFFNKENLCMITNIHRKAFFLLLDEFGQALSGHKRFNDNMKSKFTFSTVCTVSDEAFAIFTLERCWESWVSEMKRTIDPQEILVKPKHTKEKSNKKFGGWDQEGLKRFSTIAKIIGIERTLTRRKELEESYRQMYYDKLNSPVKDDQNTDKDYVTIDNTYVAYNDLGSDEDICEGNMLTLKKQDSEDQENENDDDCVQTDTQDIAYGQDQPLSLKDQGKFGVH